MQINSTTVQNNVVNSTLNDNKMLDKLEIPSNEADLRVAFIRQFEELRIARRELSNSKSRIKELEDQLRKMPTNRLLSGVPVVNAI